MKLEEVVHMLLLSLHIWRFLSAQCMETEDLYRQSLFIYAGYAVYSVDGIKCFYCEVHLKSDPFVFLQYNIFVYEFQYGCLNFIKNSLYIVLKKIEMSAIIYSNKYEEGI